MLTSDAMTRRRAISNPPMTAKSLQRELLDALTAPPSANDFWPFAMKFIRSEGLEDVDEFDVVDGPLADRFMRWIEDENIVQKWFDTSPADMPPKFFFENATMLPKGTWLIHHSDADFEGFGQGVTSDRLGLSTHSSWKDTVTDHNTWDDLGPAERVYTFAFRPKDDPAVRRDGTLGHSPYGGNWYLFRSDAAVRAYHNSDEEWQVIVPSGTEYDFLPIVIEGTFNFAVWLSLDRLREGAVEALEEHTDAVTPDQVLAGFDTIDELTAFLDEYLIAEDTRLEVAKATPNARALPVPKDRIREISKRIAGVILDLVKDHEGPLGKVDQLWGKVDAFRVTPLRGEPFPVIMRIRSEPSWSPKFVPSAGVKRTRTGDAMLELVLNGRLPVESFREFPGMLEENVYSKMLHEWTHLADPYGLEYRDPGFRQSAADDPDWYYNQPPEVTAFLQQVTDEVEAYLPDFPTLAQVFGPGKAVDVLIGMSATWQRVAAHMTPKNQARVLRAVARLATDWAEAHAK